MLDAVHRARILLTFQITVGQRHHRTDFLTERALTDDGIGRVGVDVQYGTEVDVDAQATRVPADGLSVGVGQGGVPGSPQGHGPRQPGGGIQTHAQIPLRVHGHEQGDFRCGLQFLTQGKLPARPALHEDNAAQMVFFDVPFQQRRVLRPFVGISCHHKELAHLFCVGQGRQLFLRVQTGLRCVVHPGAGLLGLATQRTQKQQEPGGKSK